MKGLLYNDYMSIQKVLKTVAIIVVLFGTLAIMSGNVMFAASYIEIVFVLMVPINIFYADEKNKWEQYAFTMPISKKQYVLEKYIFFLIVQLFGYILSYIIVLCAYLHNKTSVDNDIFAMINVVSAVSMLLAILGIPILLKWGAEKGRIALIAIMIIPLILIKALESSHKLTGVLDAFGKYIVDTKIVEVFEDTYGLILFIPMFILYGISYLLSLQIYKKKEF